MRKNDVAPWGEKKKKCGLVTKHAVEELYKKKKKKNQPLQINAKEKCKESNDFQEAEFEVRQKITRYSIKMNWALYV